MIAGISTIENARSAAAMKYLMMGVLGLCCASALADENTTSETRAVREINGDAGLSFEDVRSSGGPNKTVGLNVDAIFPIGSYLGFSLSGDVAKTNIDVARHDTILGTTPSCSINDTGVEAGLFTRNPTLGKIGVSYGIEHLHSSCDGDAAFVASQASSNTTHNYQAEAEYYLHDFTFGAAHTQSHVPGQGDLKQDLFSVSWYPVTDARITPSAGRQDRNDLYGITLEAQPEFLSESVSVVLSYSLLRQSSDIKSFSIGFVHHFGNPIELQTRDRNYR
jgi:hypothetical protein